MWYVLLLAPLLVPLLWSLARPLSWIIIGLPVVAVYSETLSRDDRLSQVYPLEWTDKPPSVPPSRREDAVSTLADLIVRDFVTKWHSILIEACDDESAAAFPRAVTQLLCDVLHRILTRVVQLDMSTLLMQRMFPTLREHVERFRSAQNSLRGLTVPEEDPTFHDWFLATKYQQGELHPAVGNTSSLTTKESEHAHLRLLMNRFLHAFTHDMTCLGHVEAALLREILACSLLYPIIDLVTNPDWIHMQIASRAESRMFELQQVDRVRESLSAAASETSILRKATLYDYPASSPRRRRRAISWRLRASRSALTKSKKTSKYERFLVQIEHTESLLDLRRIRHELLNECQRTKKELSKDPSNLRLTTYVGKLKSALDIAERRTAALGCMTEVREPIHERGPEDSQELARISLPEILRNSASLAYLLEFMDLRGRAMLVRFWILVDTLKDPLEEVDRDDSTLHAQALMKEVVQYPDSETYRSTRTLQEAMELVLPYCTSPLFQVRESYRELLEAFLALDSSVGVREPGLTLVRQCVLMIQADVLQMMLDQDWEPFTASHLYAQAADQARPAYTSTETTSNATYREWDTDSDDSRNDDHSSFRQQGDHNERQIPLRYGSLMGSGDGAKSDHTHSLRKPLFESDPLFEQEPDSFSRSAQMWQPYVSEQDAPTAHDKSADMPSMDLAWMRHQRTTKRLHELRSQSAQLLQQREKLDILTKKAELTGASPQEMRLLQTSRKAIDRDMRTVEWERNYLEHLSHQHGHIFDAKHASRVAIEIKDTEEGKDQAGHTYILYHILVRMTMTGKGTSEEECTWVITRRYSAFRELHQSLKHQFRSIWACETLFPGKKLVGSMNATFIESRRRSLERYLLVRSSILTTGCVGTARCAPLPYHAGIPIGYERRDIHIRK